MGPPGNDATRGLSKASVSAICASMVYTPTPSLETLSPEEIARLVADRTLPPVSEWHPEHEGDSGMRIAADGTWFHDGGPIRRSAMVRAFSTLLRRDGERYFLVTPQQKLSIEVDDAPFVATNVLRSGVDLAFTLNTHDIVLAGADNRIVAMGDADSPALYISVRDGMDARLNRSTYEQLANIALENGEDWTVTSGGETFSLLPA